MQYKKTVVSAALASTALAAYVPSEPWSTLTPSATYKGGLTDYTTTFGIAVNQIATTSASSSTKTSTSVTQSATASPVGKRDVVSQIGDGQIQATTATTSSKKTSAKASVAAVSQIGDGQIQATTAPTTVTPTPKKSSVAAVSQIGDGQIQATHAPATTVKPTSKSSAAAVSQIGDGQIQATHAPATTSKSSAAAVSQIGDGQIQATTTATKSDSKPDSTSSPSDSSDPVGAQACKNDGTLAMSIKAGILTDSKGRIGSIVANRQFQFDGPPPQAGAIYAAGWSITPEGNLAIGDKDVFYQCLSGNFYNLYDESIGAQCHPVHLEAIDLVDC